MVNAQNSLSTDTIVALATPKGRGALAIIRLSGEGAIDVAARCVKDPGGIRDLASHRLSLVDVLSEDGSVLDKALCAVYHHPRSYTGENAVEFFLHGSQYIVAKTIEQCCLNGARIAEPGEFTLRAFLNGRMDLTQAEAVADLIAADSEASHKVAMLQREGALSRNIHEIRDRLIEIGSIVELEIDFSDQELLVTDRKTLSEMLDAVEKDLNLLKESYKRGRLARQGVTVSIAGAPNVGKSTLFNALVGEYRAIVHELPGTTRDPVEGHVEWGGVNVRLVDTAGQGETLSGPDKEAVEIARRKTLAADLVLWVLDLSDPCMELPQMELGERILIIGNKSDLVGVGETTVSGEYIRVSALKREGLNKIKTAVMSSFSQGDVIEYSEGILTRERHFQSVQDALRILANARDLFDQDIGNELIAEDIREAINRLSTIIGEVTPDDVLNRLFADFCIGK